MSPLSIHHAAILAAVAMTGVGQVLVKQASDSAPSGLRIFTSWRLVVGYALLFGMTLLTTFALREVTLRELSVWITLTYPVTVGLSALVLGERLGKREALGVAVLVAGLVVFGLAGDGA